MIQEPIMTLLRDNIPGLSWSIDYRTASDNTGTVYSDSGEKPSTYDEQMRYPYYQIYLRSSNFELVKNASRQVYDLLHMKMNWEIDLPIYDSNNPDEVIETLPYTVYLIEALSEPILVGVNDNVMEYSINLKTTLRFNKLN
ncbi:hypothetical protein EVU91_01235 [Macrococcoides bohemicum]|uniref:hypothetical protein n=1 Tax=Macrococcoides bohemicum TaxID=1903056 RepID=UPI00105A0BED|nr:hypothetical protein [Macrococcus bohemicus]TDL40542.1 hypothetical protein EVU91_01235 [Macrococcus bohemicus]